MVKKFLETFVQTENTIFSGKTETEKYATAIKAALDRDTYGIYAHVHTDPNTVAGTYDLIAVQKKDQSAIRFIVNDTLDKMFTENEKKRLEAFSGIPNLKHQVLRNEAKDAMDEEKEGEKKREKLPGRSYIGENWGQEQAKEILFSDLDAEVILSIYLMSALAMLCKVIVANDFVVNKIEGERWEMQIARRWIAATLDPRFPNFDLHEEIEKYMQHIAKVTETLFEDKTDPICKYKAMKDAVKGYATVTIVFIGKDGKQHEIQADAGVFSDYYIRNIDGKPKNVLDLYCYTEQEDIIKNANVLWYDENEEKNLDCSWIPKDNVKEIRSEDGRTIWGVNKKS